jgi:nitroreductase
MDLFSAIAARRSVRKFLSDPVPREVLAKMVAAGIEAPSGMNLQGRHYIIVDDPATVAALRPTSKALTGAPAAIVLVMDPKASSRGDFHIQDASAAIENMLLSAVAMGYSSCWVEGAVRAREPELRKLLGVPDHLRVWAILPVGKAAENPARPAKSAPDEVVHVNRFGTKTATT